MTFSLTRGTNISHWLSQSQARGEIRRQRFRHTDVAQLRDWGFDHLRLPIDEEQMWTPDGQRDHEAFDLLGEALDWCLEAGLNAIVDLHLLRSHHFLDANPPLFTQPKEAAKFAHLWCDLSAFLHERPLNRVAYELMNEAVARDDEDWNRVAAYPYRALREIEPTRTIVLGSNRWNQCATFDHLHVPDDSHLILTFHYYHPLLVTHYKAPWAKNVCEYTGPIQYPGPAISAEEWAKVSPELQTRIAQENKPYDAQQMEQDLAKPLAVSKKTGLPLYCGEFGVLATAPDDIRVRWYRDLLSVFQRHDIAWANWDYRGGFGLIDKDAHPTAVLEGLMGKR